MASAIDYGELTEEIFRWLKTQPQLPQEIEKFVLRRFVHFTQGNLELAKKLITLNFHIRNKNPEIFLYRDPLDEPSQKQLNITHIIQLPGKTAENYRVSILCLIDPDVKKWIFIDAIKVCFMMIDCAFAIAQDDYDGDILIFDMSAYRLRHLTCVNFGVLRTNVKFIQDAHPTTVRQIHFINAPGYMNATLKAVKPFIPSEFYNLIKVHSPNSDTLHEYFSRDLLPNEYGGKAGKMIDLKEFWLNALKEKRDYLMDETKWQLNDTELKLTTSSAMEITKNSNTLEID